jgi:hypothetical protein
MHATWLLLPLLVLFTLPGPHRAAVLRFDREVYDLGRISRGKPVSARFQFCNGGGSPLVIQAVEPSCGCTTGSFPREPVLPGKFGLIVLTYDAAKVGRFEKQAVVYSNANTAVRVLYIRGEVVGK